MYWQCQHIQWKLLGLLLISLYAAWSMYRQCRHTLDLAKTYFSHIPVFGGKVSLIFPIIYQTVDLKLICIVGQPDLINHLFLPISTLDDIFTHFGGFVSSFMVSWLLNLIETRCISFWLISTVLTLQIALKLLNYSIRHAKTSLFDDCAGGSQGVQLLDGSNQGQVRAIRLRRVWGSWYPSI